jgi:hypothetical protein
MNTKERKPGYYWVLAPEQYIGDIKWVVAEWYIPEDVDYSPRWELHGTPLSVDDSYFLEIDETPIKREP